MAYSVILGIVIVVLVVAGVIGSFWSAGSPLGVRRRHGRGDGAADRPLTTALGPRRPSMGPTTAAMAGLTA